MAGPRFAGCQLKNTVILQQMAPRRDNPLCRSAAHLSKGVLGLAVVKAVRRHAKVKGIVVNSIQTSCASERMIDLIEAPVAFD
jgi:hypothetical protein